MDLETNDCYLTILHLRSWHSGYIQWSLKIKLTTPIIHMDDVWHCWSYELTSEWKSFGKFTCTTLSWNLTPVACVCATFSSISSQLGIFRFGSSKKSITHHELCPICSYSSEASSLWSTFFKEYVIKVLMDSLWGSTSSSNLSYLQNQNQFRSTMTDVGWCSSA